MASGAEYRIMAIHHTFISYHAQKIQKPFKMFQTYYLNKNTETTFGERNVVHKFWCQETVPASAMGIDSKKTHSDIVPFSNRKMSLEWKKLISKNK